MNDAIEPPTMRELSRSTNIHSVGHDHRGLWVRFHNRTLYRFPEAEARHVEGMMSAVSAGSYFHTHVKAHHRGQRIAWAAQ